MPEIGVREFKAHTSEILQAVREQGVSYVITHRGHPTGLLIPPPITDVNQNQIVAGLANDAWEAFWRLGEEISSGWDPEITTDQLLADIRR
ncbi:MAG TPA: type II toxin-antitoxin system Phd/YefM family antitoxin [Caldilineae bacterium]|nr:type II toxin-antitoxin system Phd/YefM family antitoxin [Caldilineae bacterium]